MPRPGQRWRSQPSLPPGVFLAPSYLSMGMRGMEPVCRYGDWDSDGDGDCLAQHPAGGRESSTSAGEGNVPGHAGGSANLPHPRAPQPRAGFCSHGRELGGMGQAVHLSPGMAHCSPGHSVRSGGALTKYPEAGSGPVPTRVSSNGAFPRRRAASRAVTACSSSHARGRGRSCLSR